MTKQDTGEEKLHKEIKQLRHQVARLEKQVEQDKSTEQKIRDVRLELFEYAITHSLNELLTKTLDEVEVLTESRIGFYHFMHPDKKTLSLQAWSTRTKNEFCQAKGEGLHYKVSEAGIWADCVREKKPVIHNHYESLPHKKGLPPGHANVIRQLVVPVFRNNKIVAILGAGNKESDYTNDDANLLSYLADVCWGIAQKKRADEELEQISHDLKERNKELGCLYELSRLINKPGISIDHLMQSAVDLIPPAMQDPGFTCARILIDEKVFKTKNFKETTWRKSTDIFVNEKPAGTLEVCYVKETSPLDEGPFLKDEHNWIDAFAKILGNYLERKRTEAQLELLSRSVEQNPVAIVITDPDGNIEYVNPAFHDITGYAFEEVKGKNPRILQSGHHTRDFYKQLWDTILSGNDWEGEFRNKKKNGDLYWEKACISPIVNPQGEITNIVAIKEDVTELKVKEERLDKSLEEKNVLLTEIHHRVKNNMAIISSLLKLDAERYAGSVTGEVLMKAESRIRSMALIHEKLYQNESFSNIAFDTYIEELGKHIRDHFIEEEREIRFVFDTEEVWLDITRAIPCGILLNELITNGLKHAFPEHGNGRITLELKQKNGEVLLRYRDDGVGLPESLLEEFEAGRVDSLGLTLIQGLANQIRGRLTFENRDGLFVEIRFPQVLT